MHLYGQLISQFFTGIFVEFLQFGPTTGWFSKKVFWLIFGLFKPRIKCGSTFFKRSKDTLDVKDIEKKSFWNTLWKTYFQLTKLGKYSAWLIFKSWTFPISLSRKEKKDLSMSMSSQNFFYLFLPRPEAKVHSMNS